MPRRLSRWLLGALLPAAAPLQLDGHGDPQDAHGAGEQGLLKLAGRQLVTVGAGQSVSLESLHRLEGKGGRCLNFLHIPKTAGTSVEEVSLRATSARSGGLRAWGMHDESLRCSYPYQFKRGLGCKFPGLPANQWGNQQQRCSVWHTPPAWDVQLAEAYAGCTTFCIVRDPVQRMVSEASFRLLNCNSTQFDEYLQSSFLERQKRVTANDCHLLPQSEYVYGGKFLGEPGNYCQRVLKMETLSEDFARLMQEFEIDAELTHSDTYAHNCDVKLSEATKETIWNMYGDDFTNFGYSL